MCRPLRQKKDLFCAGLFDRSRALPPSPLPLVQHGSAYLNHTGGFPNLQAMARPSFFQSPLLAQLQKQLEGQIKDQLGQRVRAMTGATGDARDFLQPAGDPGLFGPESVTWQVHAHFVAMMTGGLSSLILQALHPRALAAVWDHSSFRTQLRARLGRTALFVATTTYGGTASALQTIERVNRIHAQIRGTLPDGTPYAANEPELIRWVHLGETTSFLRAYQDLSLQALNPAQQDRYFWEMTRVGQRLGAQDLPETRHQALSQLQAYRPDLRVDERTRETIHLIENYPCAPSERPLVMLMVRAAFQMLPDWALELLQRQRTCAAEQAAVRAALQAMGASLAWAFADTGVAARARQRMEPAFTAPVFTAAGSSPGT
jgi:uncharacterized protein (DUF2236 family)